MSYATSPIFGFLSHLSVHQRGLLLAFVALKLALILLVPLTGDEAYFIVWGYELSLGYYDHPPMVGWVLYLISGLADNLVVYRLFAFFAAAVISFVLYQTLRLHPKLNKDSAFYVAMAFFVSPISLMFVVTANDTVLVFFSVLAFYFYARTLAKPTLINAVLAGLFLGFAFLSKYFAAFMLVGLFAYSLVYIKQVGWKWLAVMTAIILLFVAENIFFNATNGWNNILFNFFSRTTESTFEISNVLSYIFMVIFLLSPLALFYLFKEKVLSQEAAQSPLIKQVLFASLPLLAILLLVSFTNGVGLHWPLIAVTLMYLLYSLLPKTLLEKIYLFNGYSSLVLGAILLGALAFVDQLIPASQKHHVAVYTQPEKVCAQLPKTTFFTLGYSSQSALSYHCNNDNIHVFKSVSKYGREDDKKTNFKVMDGQSIKVFVTDKKEIERVSRFFARTGVQPLKIDEENTYYLINGQGFNYALYHKEILTVVNDLFYAQPDWFPDIAGWLGLESSPFKAKYGFKSSAEEATETAPH